MMWYHEADAVLFVVVLNYGTPDVSQCTCRHTVVISSCHLVPSSRSRPLVTTWISSLHPFLSLVASFRCWRDSPATSTTSSSHLRLGRYIDNWIVFRLCCVSAVCFKAIPCDSFNGTIIISTQFFIILVVAAEHFLLSLLGPNILLFFCPTIKGN